MSLRVVSVPVVLALALAASSSAATPPTVLRGQALHISLTARSAAVCSPTVRYVDGTQQIGATKRAKNGKLAWSLLVARTAPVGLATWTVRCGRTIRGVGRFTVGAEKTATDADVPKVVVDRQGFSQRPDKTGAGGELSFGLFLRNTSQTQDALNVYVLVNMVDATGQLVGSLARTVPVIGSTATYAFGDAIHLRTQIQVVKLELTIRLGGHQVESEHTLPDFANISIVPSTAYPGYVGEVDGEILNSATTKILSRTRLSIVLLDASGNPVGGGTGSSFLPVPAGSRMVFNARNGFDSAKLDQVLSAAVSAEPTYSAVL